MSTDPHAPQADAPADVPVSFTFSVHRTPSATWQALRDAFGVSRSRDGSAIWVTVPLGPSGSLTVFPNDDDYAADAV